jgi:hypothetical protein
VKRRRGLLGFYISTGVVVTLFVACYFAWTPLRVWYWERKVRNARRDYVVGVGPSTIWMLTPRADAAKRLAALGPSARPAFQRLLSQGEMLDQVQLSAVLRDTRSVWALPLLVAVVRNEDPLYIIPTGLHIDEMAEGAPAATSASSPEQARTMILTWWEREGKAKYESDK